MNHDENRNSRISAVQNFLQVASVNPYDPQLQEHKLTRMIFPNGCDRHEILEKLVAQFLRDTTPPTAALRPSLFEEGKKSFLLEQRYKLPETKRTQRLEQFQTILTQSPSVSYTTSDHSESLKHSVESHAATDNSPEAQTEAKIMRAAINNDTGTDTVTEAGGDQAMRMSLELLQDATTEHVDLHSILTQARGVTILKHKQNEETPDKQLVEVLTPSKNKRDNLAEEDNSPPRRSTAVCDIATQTNTRSIDEPIAPRTPVDNNTDQSNSAVQVPTKTPPKSHPTIDLKSPIQSVDIQNATNHKLRAPSTDSDQGSTSKSESESSIWTSAHPGRSKELQQKRRPHVQQMNVDFDTLSFSSDTVSDVEPQHISIASSARVNDVIDWIPQIQIVQVQTDDCAQ